MHRGGYFQIDPPPWKSQGGRTPSPLPFPLPPRDPSKNALSPGEAQPPHPPSRDKNYKTEKWSQCGKSPNLVRLALITFNRRVKNVSKEIKTERAEICQNRIKNPKMHAKRWLFQLALYIVAQLSARDLSSAALVCRRWRTVTEDQLLWREKCEEAGYLRRGTPLPRLVRSY